MKTRQRKVRENPLVDKARIVHHYIIMHSALKSAVDPIGEFEKRPPLNPFLFLPTKQGF